MQTHQPGPIASGIAVTLVAGIGGTGALIVFGNDKAVGWILIGGAIGILLLYGLWWLLWWWRQRRKPAQASVPTTSGPTAIRIRGADQATVERNVSVGIDQFADIEARNASVADNQISGMASTEWHPTNAQQQAHPWRGMTYDGEASCGCGWTGPLDRWREHQATSLVTKSDL